MEGLENAYPHVYIKCMEYVYVYVHIHLFVACTIDVYIYIYIIIYTGALLFKLYGLYTIYIYLQKQHEPLLFA